MWCVGTTANFRASHFFIDLCCGVGCLSPSLKTGVLCLEANVGSISHNLIAPWFWSSCSLRNWTFLCVSQRLILCWVLVPLSRGQTLVRLSCVNPTSGWDIFCRTRGKFCVVPAPRTRRKTMTRVFRTRWTMTSAIRTAEATSRHRPHSRSEPRLLARFVEAACSLRSYRVPTHSRISGLTPQRLGVILGINNDYFLEKLSWSLSWTRGIISNKNLLLEDNIIKVDLKLMWGCTLNL